MSITDALKTDIAHSGDMMPTAGGDLSTVSGLANFKLALFHRLITVPGSLAHRPLYGVGVGLFQNSLSSFVKQQKLATLIIDQFLKDPRTKSVTRVAVVNDDTNPQLTKIQVVVVPLGYDEQTIEWTPFNKGTA
jgi:hypothetical protein